MSLHMHLWVRPVQVDHRTQMGNHNSHKVYILASHGHRSQIPLDN